MKKLLKQLSFSRLQYRYRQLRNLLVDPKKIWDETIASETEIDYFESVIAQIGQSDEATVVDMAQRLTPDRELSNRLTKVLGEPRELSILDIGAGPLTTLGTMWGEHHMHITAIDPFAEGYQGLWGKYDHKPPVITIHGIGEEIDTQFPAEHFDIVHAQNALDHTYQPLVILQKAMTLLKPGGWLILFHKENEGKRVYNEFHQWNLTEENGAFIIWKMGQKFNVRDHLPQAESITVEREWHSGLKCDFINVYIRKQS